MEELFLVNPKKKRRKTKRRKTKRRKYRRNVGGLANPAKRKRKRKAYRRGSFYRTRRNPIGFAKKVDFEEVAYLTGGALGARYFSTQLLRIFNQANQGIMGYAGDLGAGYIISQVGRRVFRSRKAERYLLLGAFVNVASRVLNDVLAGSPLIGSSSLSSLEQMIPRKSLAFSGAKSTTGSLYKSPYIKWD